MMMTAIDDVWEWLISYTPLFFFPRFVSLVFLFLSRFIRFSPLALSLFSSRFMDFVSPSALGVGIS